MSRTQSMIIILRVSPKLKRAAAKAAKTADVSVSSYIREQVAKALGVVEKKAKLGRPARAAEAKASHAKAARPVRASRPKQGRRVRKASLPAPAPTPLERPVALLVHEVQPLEAPAPPVDVSAAELLEAPNH